jgi:hypothetical protein
MFCVGTVHVALWKIVPPVYSLVARTVLIDAIKKGAPLGVGFDRWR